jgi:DnaJ-class molecular chaperone
MSVVKCPDCDGKVRTDPCRRCWGAGTVIQVTVPEPDLTSPDTKSRVGA